MKKAEKEEARRRMHRAGVRMEAATKALVHAMALQEKLAQLPAATRHLFEQARQDVDAALERRGP